jgi:alpha-beta hydrolase superfamily lysophospholipase
VVVHAHGNGGNVGYQLIPAVGMCLESGCDVLMFDYRSFGLSEAGRLNRFSVVEDLAGAITFARSRRPKAAILVLGQSRGGATAALAMREEALRETIDGLCLISAFADWHVEVCDALKSNPLTWILAYPLAYLLVSPWRAEPVEGLAAWPAHKPLLLIHGKADRVVPIHHVDIFLEGLPAATRAAAQVLRLDIGAHNALAATAAQGEAHVRSALRQWISRASGPE